MEEVVGSVKRVTGLIGEIADASAEQTAGLEQVNQAISAMDQATQQNAALVEQAAAAAASMRGETGKLSQAIGAFVLPDAAEPASADAVAPAPIPAAKPTRTAPALPLSISRKAAKEVEWEEF
jgi:methyl-accepting chemotaxis protein